MIHGICSRRPRLVCNDWSIKVLESIEHVILPYSASCMLPRFSNLTQLELTPNRSALTSISDITIQDINSCSKLKKLSICNSRWAVPPSLPLVLNHLTHYRGSMQMIPLLRDCATLRTVALERVHPPAADRQGIIIWISTLWRKLSGATTRTFMFGGRW